MSHEIYLKRRLLPDRLLGQVAAKTVGPGTNHPIGWPEKEIGSLMDFIWRWDNYEMGMVGTFQFSWVTGSTGQANGTTILGTMTENRAISMAGTAFYNHGTRKFVNGFHLTGTNSNDPITATIQLMCGAGAPTVGEVSGTTATIDPFGTGTSLAIHDTLNYNDNTLSNIKVVNDTVAGTFTYYPNIVVSGVSTGTAVGTYFGKVGDFGPLPRPNEGLGTVAGVGFQSVFSFSSIQGARAFMGTVEFLGKTLSLYESHSSGDSNLPSDTSDVGISDYTFKCTTRFN